MSSLYPYASSSHIAMSKNEKEGGKKASNVEHVEKHRSNRSE